MSYAIGGLAWWSFGLAVLLMWIKFRPATWLGVRNKTAFVIAGAWGWPFVLLGIGGHAAYEFTENSLDQFVEREGQRQLHQQQLLSRQLAATVTERRNLERELRAIGDGCD